MLIVREKLSVIKGRNPASIVRFWKTIASYNSHIVYEARTQEESFRNIEDFGYI